MANAAKHVKHQHGLNQVDGPLSLSFCHQSQWLCQFRKLSLNNEDPLRMLEVSPKKTEHIRLRTALPSNKAIGCRTHINSNVSAGSTCALLNSRACFESKCARTNEAFRRREKDGNGWKSHGFLWQVGYLIYLDLAIYFHNSDSLGLLILQADGRRRVHGWRPGRGVSWCLGGVSVVSWWCLCGGVVVVSRRCLGSLTVVSGRCLHGVVLFWWCVGAFMVSRWCLGGALVVSQRFPCWYKVFATSWSYLGGVMLVASRQLCWRSVSCVLVAFPCVSLKAWVCFLGWSHHAPGSLTVLSCCHADDHDYWRWQWTWWWGWWWWWWWSWWYIKTIANIPWCHVATIAVGCSPHWRSRRTCCMLRLYPDAQANLSEKQTLA